jgi:hydroxymethylpyrimidine pyrophosphatase-like HAD family hydrolase
MTLRCVYCDLDGTLLGPGASLMHDDEGAVTLLGVRAVEACHRAGVELVLFSGRRKAQVAEPARLLGQRAYIYEAGSALVLDGEEEFLTGGLVPHDGVTIHEQIGATGAPALLLDHFAGRLEYHDPWHLGREVSHLFRGGIDAFEADELLSEHGHGDLRLVDNGAISRTMAGVEHPRAYHLIPRAASKARAVQRHAQARGYAPEETIAVGDSREDLGAAPAVGTFWLVANALEKDPTLVAALAAEGNVRVADERYGAGVYEAVITELAERR